MLLFVAQLRRFKNDESGVFAVIFAVMALVLIALGGSVVDYTMLQQRRGVAQVALDTATLALQSEIKTLSRAELGTKALDLVRNRLRDNDVTVSIESVAVDKLAGSVDIVANFDAPTYFVTLVGVHSLGASVRSQATRKSLNIEIAMVLDNSGSMETANRMAYLKQAATNATNIFFQDALPSEPRMFVGLVPFTQYVNVGTSNANAAWMDRNGISEIADDNLTMDPHAGLTKFDRIALFNSMATERWRGCVEARVFPYDTNDTAPATGQPNTLFVPLLAPDEPDTKDWRGQYEYNNTYIADQRGQCEAPAKWTSFSEKTLQERMCKYNGAPLIRSISMEYARGPNADCPTNALTPLTDDKAKVVKAISDMYPQGGTNIAQGAVWGLHMLTPAQPLNQAMQSDQTVTKVMIIMTDGDNFHAANNNMNGSTFYTAYGYPANRRLGKPGDSTATFQELMNKRLLATCDSAKKLGIKVYTIGLSMTSRTTENMLDACSSGKGYAFLPKKPTELDAIFKSIADQLSVLRISR